MAAAQPPPWHRQALNVVLCFFSGALLVYFRRWIIFFPVTVETIWQISLAEVNRRKNIRRVHLLHKNLECADEEKRLSETERAVRCLASVVGYREEPELFRKCLESYRGSAGLEALIVGVDGNESEDMEMVRVAQDVYRESLTVIPIEEPYGSLAVKIAENYVRCKLEEEKYAKDKLNQVKEDVVCKALREESHRVAIHAVRRKALEALWRYQVLKGSSGQTFRPVCLYQPHACKKDIMFTSLIFGLALGRLNDIDYLWTSDSDTWVYTDTLYQTIGCMAADPLIGGSCTALSIHNEKDSLISMLGSAAYWSELAITRGQTGAVDAVDCQPGPCAAFRLDALEPILMSWYTQTSLGVKTVVNEDRHLTTNLLLNGWKVTFNTQTLASTDTPTTLLLWLLQQFRWARATHIETFQYPSVYSIHGPIVFVTAMRRFYGPLLFGIVTVRYVLTGHISHAYSPADLAGRIFLCTAYNFICNKKNVNSIFHLVWSQVFYQLPLPGIILWSVLTFLEGNWGTQMRSQGEKRKRVSWWGKLWSTTVVVVVWMGFVGAGLAKYAAGKWAPQREKEMMVLSAVSVVVTLYYHLLK